MAKSCTCFCTASIHKGHLNIIAAAKKLGTVVVGVLSDEAAIRYNRFPAMQSVAGYLLRHHRALEVDSRLLPFKKIITFIDS